VAEIYRQHHPERTVFYRVFFHYFDRFLLEYENRFEREYGYLRPVIQEVVDKYLDCGGFEVIMSSAERAVMEQMRKAGSNADIKHAYQLMEGLSTLRPYLVQELLENCRSVKVKRLFLWSAEKAGHDWFERLESSRVDLGKGKRQIYKGGQFNKKYQITVPQRKELPGVCSPDFPGIFTFSSEP